MVQTPLAPCLTRESVRYPGGLKRDLQDLENGIKIGVTILKVSRGKINRNIVPHECIRERLRAPRLQDKLREGRLRWYGHVRRRGEEYVSGGVENMKIGIRRQGRPRRRMHDCHREDTREVGVREHDAQDRRSWNQKIRTGDP
ncbi:uncharacterized protein LOC119579175 [Penaeus monodon]|uniref:uncharacterized protein LOC119579175 n=1 Tax=Penaeus monodon TaxID=6687 RepID=UPI0018A7A0B4|nr:uncharacterized protein LOC119579175 [Penaeus monodon]